MENLIISTLAARKKTILVLFFIISSILTAFSFAQPSITWQKLYDSPYALENFSYKIVGADSGKFYVIGHVNILSDPYYGAVNVINIDEYGNIIWNRIIDTLFQFSKSGCLAFDGGCITVGSGARILKLNRDGSTGWFKRYNMMFVQLWDIIQTNDNGYIAAGFINNIPRGGYIIKIDSLGNFQWNKIIPANDAIFLFSIEKGIDTGYIIAGYSRDENPNYPGAFVSKIDNNGNFIITPKVYFINNNFTKGQVIRRFNNGYLLGGNSGLSNYVMKLNQQLDSIKTFIYPSPPITAGELQDLRIIDNRKWVFTLDLDSSIQNINFTKVLITDTNGIILNSRNFYGGDFVKLLSIQPVSNGDIVFTGYGDYYSNGYEDAYAVRTDSNLNSPPIGIVTNNNSTISKFRIRQNYPNPFNASTNIEFDISIRGYLLVEVYNILGEKVKNLYMGSVNAGVHNIAWSANDLPSGIYFLKAVLDGKYFSIIKLMLIK